MLAVLTVPPWKPQAGGSLMSMVDDPELPRLMVVNPNYSPETNIPIRGIWWGRGGSEAPKLKGATPDTQAWDELMNWRMADMVPLGRKEPGTACQL